MSTILTFAILSVGLLVGFIAGVVFTQSHLMPMLRRAHICLRMLEDHARQHPRFIPHKPGADICEATFNILTWLRHVAPI